MKHPRQLARMAVCVPAVAALCGCISVKPPDKPIEINLNVAIRQEVLVRLQQDAQQLINQNPQAFPSTQPPGTPQ